MLNWNWKCECCLLFGGLLVGGPLGTQFYKTIQKTVQYSSGSSSTISHHFFRNDDSLSSSTLSLLVPSSLWFLVTTSCVGSFFWLLGEVLRKLHSATRNTTTTTTSARSMDAASRSQREGGGGGGGGVDAGNVPHAHNRHRGVDLAARQNRALAMLMGGEGGGLLIEGHDNILLIHHLVARGLILLPHGRVRLWGITFL